MKRTGRTCRRPLFAGDDKFRTILPTTRKQNGAYYTPESVVQTLLSWVIRSEDDRLLDPSCGDGRFIAKHPNSVGIEWDSVSVEAAKCRAPSALVHDGDFFAWAARTADRFDCVAGNPPFIRYQKFKGKTRARTELVPGTRCRFHRPDLVLGPFSCHRGFACGAWRPDGFRRSRRDRPRALWISRDQVSRRAIFRGPHRRGAVKALPDSV